MWSLTGDLALCVERLTEDALADDCGLRLAKEAESVTDALEDWEMVVAERTVDDLLDSSLLDLLLVWWHFFRLDPRLLPEPPFLCLPSLILCTVYRTSEILHRSHNTQEKLAVTPK